MASLAGYGGCWPPADTPGRFVSGGGGGVKSLLVERNNLPFGYLGLRGQADDDNNNGGAGSGWRPDKLSLSGFPRSGGVDNNSSMVAGLGGYSGAGGRSMLYQDLAGRPRMRVCFDPEHEIPLLQKWFMVNNHPTRTQVSRLSS